MEPRMDEVVEQEDRFYIVAGASAPDVRTLVLKHSETFAIFNSLGDIESKGPITQGIFCEGMRHLSRLRLRIDGQRPLLLGSKVTDDNTRIIIDMMNPDEPEPGGVALPRGTLHMQRTLFLWGNACFERLTLASFALQPVHCTVSVRFGSDFADIFEVRGTKRARRGVMLAPLVSAGTVVLGYNGLDGLTRRTRVDCSPSPSLISDSEIQFKLELIPREKIDLFVTVSCEPA